MSENNEHLAGVAINFYNEGKQQLDEHVLVGEQIAKTAVLVGLVLQKNVILSGLPGGGKSTLASNLYRLISDVGSEDVVMIPGLPDLTATQLVGGKVTHDKLTTELDESGNYVDSWTETSSHNIKGMIQPTTKGLHLEEPNRAAPHAIQSLLPVLENRRLETTAGQVELPDLLYSVTSMNPTDIRQATFPMSNAWGGRLNIGAEMGVTEDAEERVFMNKLIRQFKGNPENIKPIVDSHKLAQLKGYVLRAAITEDGDGIGDLIDKVTITTVEALKDNRIVETDRRISQHIVTNAQALAGMRTEDNVVRPLDVNDSVHLVVNARIGAQSSGASGSANNIAEAIMATHGWS